jgi:hypothetical protein
MLMASKREKIENVLRYTSRGGKEPCGCHSVTEVSDQNLGYVGPGGMPL